MNLNILHDFVGMKNRIIQLATKSDVNTANMDIGNVDEGKLGLEEFRINTRKCSKSPIASQAMQNMGQQQHTQQTGVPINVANNEARPTNPDIICHNCKGKGHIARNCPQPDQRGQQKGAWGKNGWLNKGNKGQWSKGGWNKGASKGYNSKGGGNGKGKGVYAVDDWHGEEQWYWDPTPFAGCVEEQMPVDDHQCDPGCSCGTPVRELVIDESDDEEWCGVCEEDNEDDIHFEDENDVDVDNHEADHAPVQTELSPVEWPCLEPRGQSLQQLRDYVKERNTPSVLSPDEWARARARMKEMAPSMFTVEKAQSSWTPIDSVHTPPADEAPWTVKVNTKNRSNRKKVRTAVAPDADFTGVIDENVPQPLCVTGEIGRELN